MHKALGDSTVNKIRSMIIALTSALPNWCQDTRPNVKNDRIAKWHRAISEESHRILLRLHETHLEFLLKKLFSYFWSSLETKIMLQTIIQELLT